MTTEYQLELLQTKYQLRPGETATVTQQIDHGNANQTIHIQYQIRLLQTPQTS